MLYNLSNKKNIMLIWFGVPNISSKAIFQRIISLSEKFNIFLFSTNKSCNQIINKVKVEFSFPFSSYLINRIFFPFWVIFKFIQIKKKNNIEAVITLYPPYMLIVGIFLKKFFHIIWIADLLDHPNLWLATHKSKKKLFYFLGRIYHTFLLKIIKKELKNADLIISVGSCNYLIDEYSVPKKKIFVTTNGVDLNYINKIRHKNSNLVQLNNNYNILLYVGHIREERGSLFLLKIISLLKEKGFKVKLHLVGNIDPDDRKLLDQEIKKLKITERVNITGFLPHQEVWKEIINATICLYPFPSKPELDYVFPIKVFEYLGMGKAVVASDLPAMRQIIYNGKNGILVPPQNLEKWVEAIIKLLLNIKLRKKIEENARIFVKKFDWKIINKEIINKIEFLLDKK